MLILSLHLHQSPSDKHTEFPVVSLTFGNPYSGQRVQQHCHQASRHSWRSSSRSGTFWTAQNVSNSYTRCNEGSLQNLKVREDIPSTRTFHTCWIHSRWLSLHTKIQARHISLWCYHVYLEWSSVLSSSYELWWWSFIKIFLYVQSVCLFMLCPVLN